MKRVILIIVSILIMCSGCNNPSQKNSTDNSSYDFIKVYSTLDDIQSGFDNEMFIAQIVSREGTIKANFPNYENTDSTPVLYTAKIKRALWSLSIVDDETIHVVHYEPQNNENDFSQPFEVGKDYLIYGVIQPYSDKAVVVDKGVLTSKIQIDGRLIPITNESEQLLENIKTIEDFLEYKSVKEMCQTKPKYIPMCFYQLATPEDNKVSVNGIEKAEITSLSDKQRAEVIDILKEAVKVDSKVTIDLGTDEK